MSVAQDNLNLLTVRCLICQTEGIPTDVNVCPNCGANIATLLRDTLTPGTILAGGAYQVGYVLGRGGFGITYRGRQTALEQTVAIKEFYLGEYTQRETTTGRLVILSDREEEYTRGLARFVREGKTLASLSHPNVVRVLNLFEDNSTAYLVMEYLEGKTLKAVMKEARLPEDRIRQIMGSLVDALAAVHDKAIFHLDIKPANVLVEPGGRVVLIDFGAARQGIHSQTTVPAYTPSYAPIEVMSAESVGPYSDIFEMGMMLHEMVTGTLPPPALDRITKLARSGDWHPDPEKVAEPWATLIRSALPLRTEDRPQNVRSWWDSVMGAGAGAIVTPTISPSQPGSFPAPPTPFIPGGAAAGSDMHATAVISPAVAKNGGEASYTTENNERGTFKCPPGIWEGYVHRVPGQGNPGKNGGRPGALVIKVSVRQGAATLGTGNSNSRPGTRSGNSQLGTVSGIRGVTVSGAPPRNDSSIVKKVLIGVGVLVVLAAMAFVGKMFLPNGNTKPGSSSEPPKGAPPKKNAESKVKAASLIRVCNASGARANQFCQKTQEKPESSLTSNDPCLQHALKCKFCGEIYPLMITLDNGKREQRKFCVKDSCLKNNGDGVPLELAREIKDFLGRRKS